MEVLFRLSLPSARGAERRTLRSYRIMDYRLRFAATPCAQEARGGGTSKRNIEVKPRGVCIDCSRRIIVANTRARASPHVVGASRFASRGSTARRPAIVARLIVSSQAVIEILKSVAAVVAQRGCVHRPPPPPFLLPFLFQRAFRLVIAGVSAYTLSAISRSRGIINSVELSRRKLLHEYSLATPARSRSQCLHRYTHTHTLVRAVVRGKASLRCYVVTVGNKYRYLRSANSEVKIRVRCSRRARSLAETESASRRVYIHARRSVCSLAFFLSISFFYTLVLPRAKLSRPRIALTRRVDDRYGCAGVLSNRDAS